MGQGIKGCIPLFILQNSFLTDVVAYVLNSYLETWQPEQLQMINRVLVQYYGYHLGNNNTLPPAINKLSNDLVVHRNLIKY